MKLRTIITLLIVCGCAGPALAYVASSTNYRLERDSINFAGNRSTSSSYAIEDTLGEIGTGTSTSASYNIYAGYQAMESDGVSITISLDSPSDVSLSPSISGASGGTSDGTVAWTVTTNNTNGYTLAVAAGSNPALSSGSASFTDYTPGSADPDFSFSVAASDAEFGFSPEGGHVVSRFKDNGSACATGSSNTTDACWDGFSTSGTTVASSASANSPSGTATTLKVRAVIGSSKTLSAGTYNAVITATALTL